MATGLLLDADGRWLGSADPDKPPPRLSTPDIIGCVSAAGPYVGFNQASRATFSYNMMQRAAGLGAVPGAAVQPRLKDVYTLEYGQSPIVTTCSTGCGRDDLMCGTGLSCSVVVIDSLASGGNPEDAVMVSQKFADLGGLSLRRETILEATEDGLRGKYLGKAPDAPFALPVDDDGLISAGTVVRPGDVVAAFVDGSTIQVPPRWERVGQVQSVAISQADNGDRTATIRVVACGIGLLDGDKVVRLCLLAALLRAQWTLCRLTRAGPVACRYPVPAARKAPSGCWRPRTCRGRRCRSWAVRSISCSRHRPCPAG